jgi:5-methylcytosine-specific restriction protein A
MPRQEFPRAVRVEIVKRATRDSIVYCEACGLPAKRFQIDHVIADSHGGKPIIENAKLICEPCYLVKNPKDTTVAAKLKRVEAAHLGVKTQTTRPLKGPKFPVSEKAAKREPKPSLPTRRLYEDVR